MILMSQPKSWVKSYDSGHGYSQYNLHVVDWRFRFIKQRTLVSGGVRGTTPWMALELLNRNKQCQAHL